MTKLYVGMPVHVRIKGINNNLTEKEAQPFIAFVTYIHSPLLINCAGWNSIGQGFAYNDLELLAYGTAQLPGSGSYAYYVNEDDAPRIQLLN